MNWTDLPCNELLKRVFSKPPKVGDIDISGLDIKTEGPTVIVRFDLVDLLPDNTPEKWGKDFNRCRMGINCFGVTKLFIEGLATNIIARISFEFVDEVSRIIISGKDFSADIVCLDLSVTGPSVYTSL